MIAELSLREFFDVRVRSATVRILGCIAFFAVTAGPAFAEPASRSIRTSPPVLTMPTITAVGTSSSLQLTMPTITAVGISNALELTMPTITAVGKTSSRSAR